MEEKIYFDNGLGVKLCGVLNLPRKDAPIVIIAHGFGSAKDSGNNVSLASALAQKGLGSFRFDFYGHAESEGAFEDITFTEGVNDIGRAYAYVRRRFPAARIGLYGSSFGGGSSFYAATELGVAGLVLVCPAILYFEAKRKEIGFLGARYWQLRGRIRYKTHDGRRLPLKYSFYTSLAGFDGRATAPKIKVPVLLFHGDADKKIPCEQSVELAKLMPGARLVTFHGTDHYFRKPNERARLTNETVRFFTHLFALDNHA